VAGSGKLHVELGSNTGLSKITGAYRLIRKIFPVAGNGCGVVIDRRQIEDKGIRSIFVRLIVSPSWPSAPQLKLRRATSI
jgi:hypothetical protein